MHGMNLLTIRLTLASVLIGAAGVANRTSAAEIDLARAVVVVPDGLPAPENKAVQFLVEEGRSRTGITWDVTIRWPGDAVPVIAIGTAQLLRSDTSPVRQLIPPQQAADQAREGFEIRTVDGGGGAPVVLV